MDISKDIFQIDAEIAQAWTLPAELYTDPSILIAEKERLFSRTWQVVGHRSQVAAPGDYFTTELLGEPLLLCAAATLNCAVSTTSAGTGPDLRQKVAARANCFAAATTAGPTRLTDRSSVRPRSRESKDFRPEDFALKPVRTEEWFNLVFVNLDPQARPLQESLGELPRQAEKFAFCRDEIVRAPHL